jgi:hypothetical protein
VDTRGHCVTYVKRRGGGLLELIRLQTMDKHMCRSYGFLSVIPTLSEVGSITDYGLSFFVLSLYIVQFFMFLCVRMGNKILHLN